MRYSLCVIRSAFFDVGNVLLFFSHERMCRQLASVYGCSAGRMRSVLFSSGLADEYDLGRVTTQEVFERLGEAVGRSADLRQARTAAAEIFEPNESIVPIVDELQRRSVKLILLSNTCEVHSSYCLERFGILGRFDDRVLSWEVGFRKPDDGIFRVALERAGCSAEECLFVDDIEDYVEAAARLGIRSQLFLGAADLARTLDLGNLRQEGAAE